MNKLEKYGIPFLWLLAGTIAFCAACCVYGYMQPKGIDSKGMYIYNPLPWR